MKHMEQRRVVPVSMVMTVCFSVMGILQVTVIAGGLELKSSTVQKIAPWAYEPFLKMVGEHPDQLRYKVKKDAENSDSSSGVSAIAGFTPDELRVSLDDAVDMPSTNILLEPTMPEADPETEDKSDPESDIPVG